MRGAPALEGNVSSCPISMCDIDPTYCEEHLSGDHLLWLYIILAVPPLVAILAPYMAGSRRGKDDDTSSALSPGHSPDPGQRRGPALGAAYTAIDPPMFLCGVGLLPLDCGLSGLLVIISLLAFAVVVVFIAMVNAPHPCQTGLGACRTISCVCGNLLPEGYAFMLVSLTITSLILVQRISRMTHHHRIQHRVLKGAMILGSLLLTLTGVFPERYDANGQTNGFFGVMYNLHLLGVFGSGLGLMWVPCFWFIEHWWTHRHTSEAVPLRSLCARVGYFGVTMGFGVAMLYYTEAVEDEVYDYCSYLTSPESCNGFPQLTADECARATGCVNGSTTESDASLCDGMVQPNFRCRWVVEDDLTEWTRLVAPAAYVRAASCVKDRCPLYDYGRGIALEFAVLLLTVSYVSSFALHDVRRLLDRPGREARSSVGLNSSLNASNRRSEQPDDDPFAEAPLEGRSGRPSADERA